MNCDNIFVPKVAGPSIFLKVILDLVKLKSKVDAGIKILVLNLLVEPRKSRSLIIA